MSHLSSAQTTNKTNLVVLNRNMSTRHNNVHMCRSRPDSPTCETPQHKHSKDPTSSLTHLKLGLMLPVDLRSHDLHNQSVSVCVCFVLRVQQSLRVHELRCVCVGAWQHFLQLPSVVDIFGCQVGLRWGNNSQKEEKKRVQSEKSAPPIPPTHLKAKPKMLFHPPRVKGVQIQYASGSQLR